MHHVESGVPQETILRPINFTKFKWKIMCEQLKQESLGNLKMAKQNSINW